MAVILVTGSAGLIGSEAVRFFCRKGYTVIGIDNDMRASFFGEEASTDWNLKQLEEECPTYVHWSLDIRDSQSMSKIFREYGSDIHLIIHTAAQPSHDWAARDPLTDFTINANGTLMLLENTRRFTPDAVFIFTSTNKVYGNTPNSLPFIELETRWELEFSHPYYKGLDESVSIDQTMHSLFGASKLAADILVQEYGKYFGMKTACFRAGCLTGPSHSGTQLHGFLSYLMKCALTGNPYTIFGYKGKQVRDNIHSFDFVNAIFHYFNNPHIGEVYNIGGGRYSNCSLQEAVAICEEIIGRPMKVDYTKEHRSGDHIWWVSNTEKFEKQYPDWRMSYNVRDILGDIFQENKNRWR
jgi:CDP-paratose 2-epimerase